MKISIRMRIYLVLMVIFLSAVVIKQNIIKFERNKEIVSSMSEWGKHGQPVVVKKTHHQDVPNYKKVTVKPKTGKVYESYITRNMQRILNEGGLAYWDGGDKRVFGRVLDVKDEIDINTGMFGITVEFDEEIQSEHELMVVYLNAGTLKDVILTPNDVIDVEREGNFVWTVIDGVAVRKKIILGIRNGFGAVVEEGLEEGDLIVLSGQTMLEEGRKVMIMKCIDCDGPPTEDNVG